MSENRQKAVSEQRDRHQTSTAALLAPCAMKIQDMLSTAKSPMVHGAYETKCEDSGSGTDT